MYMHYVYLRVKCNKACITNYTPPHFLTIYISIIQTFHLMLLNNQENILYSLVHTLLLKSFSAAAYNTFSIWRRTLELR